MANITKTKAVRDYVLDSDLLTSGALERRYVRSAVVQAARDAVNSGWKTPEQNKTMKMIITIRATVQDGGARRITAEAILRNSSESTGK